MGRALRLAHNVRDAAWLEAVAAAAVAHRAPLDWVEVGLDAFAALRRDPPDALLWRVAGAAVLERDVLTRLSRAWDGPPIPAIVVTPDADLLYRLPAFDVCLEPADPARVAAECVAVGRRAQAWRASGAPGPPRRFTLPAADFDRLADLISRRVGLRLEDGKLQNIGTAVGRRMRAGAFRAVAGYLGHLAQGDEDQDELGRLLPGLVVGETSFFRTPAHFAALREVVLPDLARRERVGPLRVWSAGCATGEEAYSIAIAVREDWADAGPATARVLATDVDQTALAAARRGVYRQKDLRKLPAPLRDRHFVKVGDQFHVDEAVRACVEFRPFNLQADWRVWARTFPDGLDIIFCENVLIYFRKDLIPPLLERFAAVLRPGGYLFLGYSESLYAVAHPFQSVTYADTFFYRKPTRDPVPAAAPGPGATPGRRPTQILRVVAPTPAAAGASATALAPAPPLEALDLRKTEARERLLAGELAVARDLYAEILRADPRSRGARVALAFCALKAGDGDGATRWLDDAARDAPLDPELYYFRGLAAAARGDAADARRQHERALFLDADFVPAHFQLGELAASEGRRPDALRHFRNAAGAMRRAPGAVISLEGIYREHEVASLCARNAEALAPGGEEART